MRAMKKRQKSRQYETQSEALAQDSPQTFGRRCKSSGADSRRKQRKYKVNLNYRIGRGSGQEESIRHCKHLCPHVGSTLLSRCPHVSRLPRAPGGSYAARVAASTPRPCGTSMHTSKTDNQGYSAKIRENICMLVGNVKDTAQIVKFLLTCSGGSIIVLPTRNMHVAFVCCSRSRLCWRMVEFVPL